MTELLHCEIPTLGYPRAVLFAFSTTVLAGNALAILKGNLRSVHEETMVAELSDYALVNDLAEVYPGMMVAVPTREWSFVNEGTLEQVAGTGRENPGGTQALQPPRAEEAEGREKFGKPDSSHGHEEVAGPNQGHRPATREEGKVKRCEGLTRRHLCMFKGVDGHILSTIQTSDNEGYVEKAFLYR